MINKSNTKENIHSWSKTGTVKLAILPVQKKKKKKKTGLENDKMNFSERETEYNWHCL